jgi:glycine/D-amino acid oxidase-like deaminating enzyme
MQPDTFHQSLWSALAPAPADLPRAEGTLRADIAIIGGGVLGLSTALALVEAGCSVVLVEAEQIAFGASGRNTGFVVPSLKGSLTLEAATNLVGPENAEALLQCVGQAGNLVFGLIKRLSIDCAAEQTGVVQAAIDDAGLGVIEAQVRGYASVGVHLLAADAAQIRAITGFPGYRGALVLPTGGQINPLAYVRGLANSALAAGARIRRGRVASIEAASGGWCLRTTEGAEIRAAQVVSATNAMIGDLLPQVKRAIIPMQSYQIATQPLDDDVRRAILPNRQPLVDFRNHPFALRWSPDHRLVTGGAALFDGSFALTRMSRFLLKRLHRLVPGLPELRVEHAWRGVIAGTGDFMPRMWDLGNGLFAPIGCNGRGVALSTALGACIAQYLLTQDAHKLPVPVTTPRPWMFPFLKGIAPAAWLAQARLRDWRNEMANTTPHP